MTYEYDAAGNVTLMTDYHDNETAYTYTDRNQLETLTAPGNKTWEFHYNALGQPTDYDIPNGMTANYTYDTRNRLTAIEYKDGTTVLDGFTYELDDSGNITRTTHEDGSYWVYDYDDRYRLIDADRFSASGNIKASYAYTYDDGDNMLTKTEPFFDDFNDGNTTGWTTSGTWSAANNTLSSTGTGGPIAMKANTDASNEIVLRYRIGDTSDANTRAYINFRHVDWSNYEWVRIFPASINIGKNVSGAGSVVATGSATSTANTWYNLRIVADGANVEVYRWADGDMPTLICSTTSSPNLSTAYVVLSVVNPYLFDFDDLRILADSLSNSTTFTVNNANELATMVDYNGTTTFTFDDWGRMTEKVRGSFTAEYGYKYDIFLADVTSDFPEEGNVSYLYSANRQQRERSTDSNTKKYRWDPAIVLINEEDENGNLTRLIFGRTLGHVSGGDPAVGPYKYYMHDQLGSTREVRNQSKSSNGTFEFTPWGTIFSNSSNDIDQLYAGFRYDQLTNLHFAPYRNYFSNIARWTIRDPAHGADGPNDYLYVRANPVSLMDPLGLYSCTYCIDKHRMTCLSDFPVAPEHETRYSRPNYWSSDDFYSGNGDCKNNPECVDIKNKGPIPPGEYDIGGTFCKPGQPKFPRRRLGPDPGNGRNGFQIHGPGRNEGCISAGSQATLDELWNLLDIESGHNSLRVVEHCY